MRGRKPPRRIRRTCPHSTGRAITVSASDGSAIPDAAVTLTKRDDKRTFALTTDAAGRASLHGIPHGDYDVVATAVGFHESSASDVSLPANEKMVLDVGAVTGVFVAYEPNRNPVRHFFNKLKTYL
jgi:hypothetical protein